MAKEYLDKLSQFIASIQLKNDVKLECKHFFSGATLYVNGKICISLTPVGLALKLPEEIRNELLTSKIAVPLKYFPKAPIKKDYVLFKNGIDAEIKELHQYVRQSIEYVASLSEQQ